jgi:predicted NACHT family NTPase
LRKLRASSDDTLAPALAKDSLAEDGEADAHWEKTPREPIFEIITSTAPKHLVILGDPGAGKSCLARYVALSLLEGLGRCQDQAAGPPRPWIATLAGRLPFVLELRRFLIWEGKDGEGGFIGYLHNLGSDHGFGLNKADLDRYLRSALSLVIFDGLDEVIDPRKRDEIAEAIVGFARTYSPARVIVTSRIAGFDQRPFMQRTSTFIIVTLDDLDLQQIEAFSKTWFDLTLRADREQAEARHKHLVQSVRDRPQLRLLAGNPLLLTVIALIARRQELPAARAGLYEHALQIFCHQWDFEDKKLELPADSPLKDLDLDDKLTVLRRVAWSMLQGEGLRANIIEKDDLEKIN